MEPPPYTSAPASTTSPAAAFEIYTYHHASCSSLILATTHHLSTLPVRRSPGLDQSIILPLPPAPASTSTGSSEGTKGLADEDGHYSILLQTQLAAKPVLVRREDGFEKRRVVRCGRCGGAVGYLILDRVVDPAKATEMTGGERRVVYLMRGGLVDTEEMMKGEVGNGGEGWWSAEETSL